MRFALLPTLLVALLLPAVRADDDAPTRLPFELKDVPANKTYWYGVYMAGNKIGWARLAMGAKDGRLVSSHLVTMKIQSMGQTVNARVSGSEVFDQKPPYALHSAESSQVMDDSKTLISLRRKGDGYEAIVRSGDDTRTLAATIDYTFADVMAPYVWFRGSRSVGDTLAYRALDFDKLTTSTSRLTIEKIRESIVGGIKQRFFEGISIDDDGEGVFRAKPTGDLLQLTMGGFIEIRLETEKTAKKLDAPSDLFVLGAVKIDKPLGDPETVTELIVEATGEGAKFLKSRTGQVVVPGTTPGSVTLKIGAHHGTPLKATPKEIEEALRSTVTYASDHELIRALAKRAVGDAKTPRDKVRRILKFVSDFIEDEYGPEFQNALQIVRAPKGDCSAHAMLFTSLARAAGIPARDATGYMYMGDEVKAFGSHAWNQVAIDGHWVEVDATWNQWPLDATHISFGDDEKGSTDHFSTFGKLKLRLISVKRKK